MKVLAFLALLGTLMLPQELIKIENPDLMIVKFSCGKYTQRSSMIRPIDEPDADGNQPITINHQSTNEPEKVRNRRNLADRRVELQTAEENAKVADPGKQITYFYRLEIKNTSPRIIRSFAWQYQPVDTSDPLERHFYCVVSVKSNENKALELLSPLAPTRVIDASRNKGEKTSDGRITINKIEYADGSVWVRPGWNTKTFPEQSMKQVASGRCIGL
jgi:hypothetical protein